MLELIDIHKAFGPVPALQGVNLRAETGTIHGLVGENGAGKSTLMKILTGFITRNRGEIRLAGHRLEIASPKQALGHGIGMLYQEPLDFPQLSVLDNFLAGGRQFSPKIERANLARLGRQFGFELHPTTLAGELTVGERQQLELLRLIRQGAAVLVLDEPTTGISAKQQELLFGALRSLRDGGTTILLVSHKLEEIELLCDTVTVLRHGRVAATEHRPFHRDRLLAAMFDRPADHAPVPVAKMGGEPVLAFDRVSASAGRSGLREVNLTIRAQEVVGLAGIDGSGQETFLRIAGGLLAPDEGRLYRFGRPVQPGRPDRSRKTVFLPADRLSEGLFPGLNLREHQLLRDNDRLFITGQSGLARSRRAIERFRIKGSPQTRVEELSGGNQQRLLLSLIPDRVRLILLENPTRGLDVQSAAWTWRHLHQLLPPDGALVFASPDLEEIMAQASRVLVFYSGQIVLDRSTGATSHSELSRAITGTTHRHCGADIA